MKAGSLTMILLIACGALVLFIATPREKAEVKGAVIQITRVIRESAFILWDKLHGIEPYIMSHSEEDDLLDWEDSPETVGDEGIFESDRTVRAKPKLDLTK
jgi:hypothetical protein